MIFHTFMRSAAEKPLLSGEGVVLVSAIFILTVDITPNDCLQWHIQVFSTVTTSQLTAIFIPVTHHSPNVYNTLLNV
ncbi:hypothetical protein QTP88_000343 [Uroleucon formosanum]